MKDSIWIADTNLVAYPFPRRFIAGCAAMLDAEVCLTPTLREELRFHLPIVLFGGDLDRRATKAIARDPDLNSRYLGIVEAIQGPLENWMDAVGPTRSGDDAVEMGRTFQTLYLSSVFSKSTNAKDARIIVEGIHGGCDMFLSNNFRTIDHAEMNDWWRAQGRNRNLLFRPQEWFRAVGMDSDRGLSAAAAMCVSNAPRSVDEDAESTRRLLGRLRTSFGAAAVAMLDILDGLACDGDGLVRMVEEARALSRTPAFRRARHAEELLHRSVMAPSVRSDLEALRRDLLGRSAGVPEGPGVPR